MELEEIKHNYFIALQQFIYHQLCNNQLVKNKMRIYRRLPKNSSYPFLFLSKLLVFDRSVKGLSRVHFLQEIRVYAREESIEEMLSWCNEIKKSLVGQNIIWKTVSITEVLFLQMELDVMTDGRTYKMIMKFKFNVEDINVSAERISNVA